MWPQTDIRLLDEIIVLKEKGSPVKEEEILSHKWFKLESQRIRVLTWMFEKITGRFMKAEEYKEYWEFYKNGSSKPYLDKKGYKTFCINNLYDYIRYKNQNGVL